MQMIGIIGKGFVGNAIFEGMKHAFEIITYDIKFGLYKNESRVFHGSENEALAYMLKNTDGPIFVCLPTPMNEDGSCNVNLIAETVKKLHSISKENRTIVIKSTVVPGTTSAINLIAENFYVCYNPEFLTEKNAVNDFKSQNRIIIGGPQEGLNILRKMYEHSFPNVPIFETSSTTAELIKYTTNVFLATKVSLANEIYQICESMGQDYNEVVKYATKDERLGKSHWSVPGPMPADDGTGRLLKGFGGSCFVKDLNALISLAVSLGVDPKVMNGVWQKNLEVRPEKDWEKLVGRAVI